jgi:FG-GAP-like repeat
MTSRRRRFVGLIGFALVGLTLKRQAHAQNPSDPEESPARNSDIITGAPAVPPAWCFGEPNSKQVYGRVDADFFADFTCLRQSDSDVDNVWTARSDGEGRFRGGRLTSAPTPYRGQGVGAQFDDISREGLYPFPMGGGRVGLLYTDAGWGNRFDVYPSLLAPAAPGTRQLPSVPAYLIGAQSFLVSSYVSAVDHDTYTCSEAPYELTVPCRTSVREVGVRNTIDGPVYYAYLSMAHRDTVTGYSYDEEAPALVQFFPDAAITPQWSPPLWELDAVYGTIEDDFFTKKQCDTLVADFDNDRNVDIVTQNCLKQQAMGSSASGVGGGRTARNPGDLWGVSIDRYSGSVLPSRTWAAGQCTGRLAKINLRNNGRTDIVCSYGATGNIWTARAIGSPATFQAWNNYGPGVCPSPGKVTVADYNGDGYEDIACVLENGTKKVIRTNPANFNVPFPVETWSSGW